MRIISFKILLDTFLASLQIFEYIRRLIFKTRSLRLIEVDLLQTFRHDTDLFDSFLDEGRNVMVCIFIVLHQSLKLIYEVVQPESMNLFFVKKPNAD